MRRVDGFSRKEGVPRKDLALAALGVEKAEKGLERERKGAKGLDEIRLSEEEKERTKEMGWTRDELLRWVKKYVPTDDPHQYIDNVFDLRDDGVIICTEGCLSFIDTGVKELPPYFRARQILLNHCPIEKLPPGLRVGELNLDGTFVEDIPEDAQIGKVTAYIKQHKLIASANKRGIEVVIDPS